MTATVPVKYGKRDLRKGVRVVIVNDGGPFFDFYEKIVEDEAIGKRLTLTKEIRRPLYRGSQDEMSEKVDLQSFKRYMSLPEDASTEVKIINGFVKG